MVVPGNFTSFDIAFGLACIVAVTAISALAWLWWASILSRTQAERRAGLFCGNVFGWALVAAIVFARPEGVPLPLIRLGAELCALAAFVGLGTTLGVWSRRRLGRFLRRRQDRPLAEAAPEHNAESRCGLSDET